MHSFGPEILFSDHEQQLGLPARIPRAEALGVADSLVVGAFRVQDDVLQHFAARQLPHSFRCNDDDPLEPAPDMSHQLLSLDAYARFAAGLRLAAFAASEAVDTIEAHLHGQAEA